MEEQILTKEIAKRLIETSGEVRGVSLKMDGEFILQEKGEEGLKKIEEEVERVGFPIKYKKISLNHFYPVGLEAITLLAVKKVFNFNDEKFREMGRFESKSSPVMRLLMGYLVSIDRAVEEISRMWKKYYTIGRFGVISLDKEKKEGILKLEKFKLDPLHCRVLEGYFSNILRMIVKSPVSCEETKCVFKGDKHHEFLLKW